MANGCDFLGGMVIKEITCKYNDAAVLMKVKKDDEMIADVDISTMNTPRL